MKKGVVLKNTEGAEKLGSLNIAWYYTWNTNPIQGTDLPFVPMVWGKNSSVPKDPQDTILILNEPDRPDQSNVAVDDAVTIWNSVKATRKGSPATAANPLKSPWFAEFMTRADPDFLCIHWYGPPKPESLLNLVDSLHARYSRPIWITEFAVAQWDTTKPMYTIDQVSNFMETVIPELEKRAHVERYAWKTRSTTDPIMGTSALFDAQGDLTPIGNLYSTLYFLDQSPEPIYNQRYY